MVTVHLAERVAGGGLSLDWSHGPCTCLSVGLGLGGLSLDWGHAVCLA